MFEAERIALLSDVLRKARLGTLDVDWRQRIAVPHRHQYQPYQDAYDLAVLAVLASEPAQWEPGVAGNWRQALDAWYCDSLINLNDSFDLQHDLRKASRRARINSLVSVHRLPVFTADQRQAQADIRLAADRNADFAAATSLGVEVRNRDLSHAWYRASLAAGGEANDWVGWYRTRVADWMDRDIAAVAVAALDDHGFRQELESPLPDYWKPATGPG